jgi:SAM-dependent methyltransferase
LAIVSREHWEEQASNWATWARKPGFDSYWTYAPAFFELLPPPGYRTLEVGCGEGRVSRDLKTLGHNVFAVDASPTLIRMAREADPSIAYSRCDAGALPFRDESFDLAIFYNSLMDFDDMDASVSEASRVLVPGGRLCASITHPFQDAGTFASRDADAPFVVEGGYLGHRRQIDVEVERDGLEMRFHGWAYPLETYFRALEQGDFAVEAVREPAAPKIPPSMDPGGARWRRIPLFLMWRAVKTA